MHVVIGYHGLDDQLVAVRVADMVRIISLVESDVVRFPSELLGRPLVRRVRGRDRSFLCVSEITVLGSSYFPDEVWPTKDSSDLARRFCFTLVLAQLGASIADIISEVSLLDEFFDLIFEHDALLCGVADVFVMSTIFVLILLLSSLPASNQVTCIRQCTWWPRIHPHAT